MKSGRIKIGVLAYRKSYYLTHPWLFVEHVWRTIRHYWHRARYGYAMADLWDFDCYLKEMVPNALDELADCSYGWPQSDTWPQFSDWQAELHVLAKLIRILRHDYLDDTFLEEWNEWRGKSILQPIEHLPQYSEYVLSDDDAAAIDAETDKYKKWYMMQQALEKVVMRRVVATIDTWWD